MRILHSTAAALALTIAAPGASHAQWYVGVDGGANVLEDSNVSDQTGSTTSVGSKTGYVIQMQGGYDFGGPKAEFEIGYRNSGLANIAEINNVGGHSSSLSFMTNGIYEFMPKASWHPFIGAGIGMARISARWEENNSTAVKDSDWQFAYQAMAGISYDLTKNWAAKAQYRYFATLDPEFTTANGDYNLTAENHNHAFLLGLTYTFGSTTPKAVQATPAARTAMANAPSRVFAPQTKRAE
ncbi:outer membrane protein [Magnetospirillum sulfuroxidans]|uniref:Porin family protein n=1 Tax=Magnetospirillum sulfuroxidans TaxID=611300 RepID=A0ABS5IC03_9PROT|nr:outer membrane beta-barrel protein [Magnetospirillum sulfuroxidans]MBR9971954.1 porin family protein [Magnetospirillum sulfuroxidans]